MARTITSSVGENAVNRKADVIAIQELLNNVPPEEGGPAPKLKVDGLAWQKTVAGIRKFQREHMYFQWPDGRVDRNGPTYRELSTYDDTAPLASSFYYEVPGYKRLVGQVKSNGGWATVYTMMRSWRDAIPYEIEQALARVGKNYVDRYAANGELLTSEFGTFWTQGGLSYTAMQCFPIETWVKLLEKRGLVAIGTLAPLPSFYGGLHMRIVEGIFGNGRPAGTYVKLMDGAPAWGGQRYSEQFDIFNAKWLGVKNSYDPAAWQIAHY